MDYKEKLREILSVKFDNAFGLDIGDGSVEIIQLQKFFRYSITTYGREELSAGVVENGRILDPNALAESLKKLLRNAKPKRVSTNKVIVSLPESQVFTNSFEVDSKLKAGALSNVILEKVGLSMLVNVDKTYWDYMVSPLPDKTKKLVTFFCVPKEIANSYVKFCNSIGLEVVSLCLEPLSLARVILKSASRQSLIIDIGSGATNLNFFDSNDKLNVSITLPVAGEQMTKAIMDRLKIERDEAETLKVKFGFQDVPENTIRPIIQPVFEDIMSEIKSAITYYEESFKQKLDDIYLIGGSALLPGLLEAMRVGLARTVVFGACTHNIDFTVMTGKNNQFVLFANVLGLGILGSSTGYRDINFLKKMPRVESNSVNKLNLLKLGYLSKVNTLRTIMNNKLILILMIAVIATIFYFMLLQIESYEKKLVEENTLSEVLLPSPVSRGGVLSTSTEANIISTSTIIK
jgi:type IV pilus assembly protein PilM